MGEYPALSEEDIAVIAVQRLVQSCRPVTVEFVHIEQLVAW